MPKPSVTEAYAVLGLEEGVSLELIRSTYKQKALLTHPDKNPDNTSATAEFQQIGEAYRVLSKYLENASRRPQAWDYDYNDDDDFDDDEYEDDSDFEDMSDDDLEILMHLFLFDLVMKGEAHSHLRSRFSRRPQVPEETEEQFKARVRKSYEEQVAAEERRKQEAAARREEAKKEREKAKMAADERKKTKKQNRKAQAEVQRQKAEQTAREQQCRVQLARSAVFGAARDGDAAKVKKGVWEDDVDAAGGEVKVECQAFVQMPPKDSKETLLHIASRNGDVDLVQWLDDHGADPEERDSAGLSAFYVALQSGHIPVATYFLEIHPPNEDTKAIYSAPPPHTPLSLALDSCEPELVWMVLDKGLATTHDINDAWFRVTSGGISLSRPNRSAKDKENADDITKLLMRFGGFTPPPTPPSKPTSASEPAANYMQQSTFHRHSSQEQLSPTNFSPTSAQSGRGLGRGGGRSRSRRRGRGRSWVLPNAAT